MNSIIISILIGLLFLLLSIPAAILANMTTPRFQSYFEKRSLVVRGKKIQDVLNEYGLIRALRDSHELTILMLFAKTSSVLLGILSMILIIGLQVFLTPLRLTGTLTNIVAILSLIFIGAPTFRICQSIAKDVFRIILFDGYKQEVITQIQKLGGNAEELLK